MSYNFQGEPYKVVICTPYGRKKYIEILKNYIERGIKSGLVDEWQLWENTDIKEDLEYIKTIKSAKIIPHKEGKLDRWNRQWGLGYFYRGCCEPKTIYIRIDDDVCWMDKDAIEKMCEFRLNYAGYFIVHGNVLNNTLNNYIQQRIGNITTEFAVLRYETWDKTSLETPPFAKKLHEVLVSDIERDDMEKYKFPMWLLFDHEHYSIMVSSWLGDTFAKFGGVLPEAYAGEDLLGIDDEQEININLPKRYRTMNAIAGRALFIHHAYFYQERNTCMNDDQVNELFLLNKYKEISDNLD